jgi:UDP-N-acetylglucosamine:LPS N-acetylglucosamine transferase
MSDRARVWVLGSAGEELDHALRDVLSRELGDRAEVELHDPEQDVTEPDGVAEKLKALVLDQRSRSYPGLARRLETDTPDVVLAARPEDIWALADVARHSGPHPTRIGVVREPVVDTEWLRAPADLLAVMDEHAAASARSRQGTVRVTGVPAGDAYAPEPDAPAARARHGLDPDAHVLLVAAGAVEPEDRTQLMIQLGLVRTRLEVIFEVESAAEADDLRQVVPAHGIDASLVPAGPTAAPFWALAHLVVTRAGARELTRVRAVAVPVLLAPPRIGAEQRRAAGLVRSGAGRKADSLATLAVDIDLALEPERFEEMVERQRSLSLGDVGPRLARLVVEALDRGAATSAASAGMPAGLERIGAKREEPPASADRIDEAVRAAEDVREKSELWSQRARLARSHGEEDLALEADKRAARHKQVLGRLLDHLRGGASGDAAEGQDMEEELEVVRRRAAASRNVEERLRSLEVEDELRDLKERLERE